jgi:predicted Kef-type K+ transport protein
LCAKEKQGSSFQVKCFAKHLRSFKLVQFWILLLLKQFGLIRNITNIKILSEWGNIFLLFGMGLFQVILSTMAFMSFELPLNGAIGTKILQFLFHSKPNLVNIRSIDEVVVIGVALSLSSSAFVCREG